MKLIKAKTATVKTMEPIMFFNMMRLSQVLKHWKLKLPYFTRKLPSPATLAIKGEP